MALCGIESQSKNVDNVWSREEYRSAGDDSEDGEQPEAESIDHHCRKLPVTADLLRVGVLSHSAGQVPHLAQHVRQQRTFQLTGTVVSRRRCRPRHVARNAAVEAVERVDGRRRSWRRRRQVDVIVTVHRRTERRRRQRWKLHGRRDLMDAATAWSRSSTTRSQIHQQKVVFRVTNS